MRLLFVALSASLLAAPATAQKFVSVTGESTRTTIGAATAAAAPAPVVESDAVADGTVADTTVAEGAAVESVTADGAVAEGDAVAEVELPAPPPSVNLGDPVETFIVDAGECNPGTLWNQETGRCETL